VVQEEEARLEWDEAKGEMSLVLEREQKRLLSIAIMNQSLKVMAAAYQRGNHKKAEAAVADAIRQVKVIFPGADDPDIVKLISELESYVKSLNNLAQATKNG